MLVLDYAMAMLSLPGWPGTGLWLRLARNRRGASGAADDLRGRGRRTRILYTAALISTSPSNPTTARNARAGVVPACVGPPEGCRTCTRQHLLWTGPPSSPIL